MRQIGFNYAVYSEIELTKDELNLLITYAEEHPDFQCKAAARVGGFLHGFKSLLSEDEKYNFIFSIKQLDAVCKILEMAKFF